jgi:hypothetical protein
MIRTEVTADGRANPEAISAAIDDRTALVVASAPCYPFGVIDPIPEIAALAENRDVLCHVDACLGGAPTTAHFGYAGPLTEAVLLGTIANRFPKQELLWQTNAMAIPNHDKANALLRRTYRNGFEVENLS